MSNLLIHSMSEFSALILDCLQKAGAREIVEVGAEFGGMSQHLANHAAAAGGRLTSIDPAPKQEFLDWVAASPQVRHLASPSLDAMPTLSGVDAWVIDGDHNYHTVSNELAIAAEQSVRDDKPLLLFLHDVGWPCGRRDFYYAPDRIPATARHSHSFDDGVVPGNPGLVHGGGFRGVGQFAVAEREGGPANGVLTAVEDFIDDLRDEGREIGFAFVPAVFGLGVVFASDQPWSADVAALLHPFHDNPLLARMEENRLLNYVTVIGWEDLTARRAGAPRIAA